MTTMLVAGILFLNAPGAYAALGDSVLKKGMRNEDVQVLQQHLKDLGYFTYSSTTTYFGSITESALKDFQRDKGLVVDGYFGPNSFKTLSSSISNEKPSPPSVEDTVGNHLTYERVLKLGLRGNDVKALQNALKNLGHLVINNTTTYYGTMTRNAVISFQRSQGISVDGYAGPQTIKTINRVLSGGSSNTTPDRGDTARDRLTESIIKTAKKYLNPRVPYVFGGSTPKGFDCSGYTQYVFREVGITIPRTTTGQATVGTKISKENLQPGDLIIFHDTYRAGPSHVGIYLGNNEFIHSRSGGNYGIDISNLNTNYYKEHFRYGRRAY